MAKTLFHPLTNGINSDVMQISKMGSIEELVKQIIRNPRDVRFAAFVKSVSVTLVKPAKAVVATEFIKLHGKATPGSTYKMIEVRQRNIRLDRC